MRGGNESCRLGQGKWREGGERGRERRREEGRERGREEREGKGRRERREEVGKTLERGNEGWERGRIERERRGERVGGYISADRMHIRWLCVHMWGDQYTILHTQS